MPHPIVDEELTLLDSVRALLEDVPVEAPPSEDAIVAELLRLREEMPNAKEEDRGALMAQYNQQFALLEQLRESRGRPKVDPASPYFAHLRLEEEGRSRDLCLGKATRIQKGIRIVDWRNAPISKIFYRYQQGEEYEEPMGGRVLIGEVTARRTITIQEGELVRVDAPEGTFTHQEADGWNHDPIEPPRLAGGEGTAFRVHGAGEGTGRRLGTDLRGSRRRVDKRLPDIAGLIDAEQFDLITQPTSGFVVIRGTAGSGKTTVALHRIAYLAYQDAQIDSAATMFLVFSPALRDYVDHVLPALGVHRVQVRTYRSWAREQTRKHFPRLPRTMRDDTPEVVTRLKVHPAMIRVLELQVETVSGQANAEQAMDDWSSALTNRALLGTVLEEMSPGSFSPDELDNVVTWCRDRHEELFAWLEDKSVEFKPELDPEDDALLLRAWQIRVGALKRRSGKLTYKHIALDEVQDFSPIEVRVLLGCLDEKKSITLAGDTQQHVMQDAGFTSWTQFFDHLGVEGTSVNTLRVAYRSSREIVSFALGLLGSLREDDELPLTVRSGPQVETFRFTDHGACVAFLADALKALQQEEPLASIALLTPSSGVSELYYRGLNGSDVPHLRRVANQDFTFQPGVEITEIEQVKGLEFDYVVLVEASVAWYEDKPANRRLLHVGATRAVHQLWLTSVAELSTIVEEAIPEPGRGA